MSFFRKFSDSSKELANVRSLAACGMLLALNIVAAYYSKFALPIMPYVKIGLMFIPVIVSAYLFGPISAAIVCAGGDILSTLLNNTTPFAFNPGITFCCILEGIIYGLALYHSELRLKTLIIAKAAVLVFCHLPVNTIFLSIMMNIPYPTMLFYRAAVLIPFAVIEVAVMTLLRKPLIKIQNTIL